MSGLKTGLVSISFRNLEPEKIIALAAACGLDAIEWGGDVHVPHGDVRQACEVREMTRKAGLEVSAYGSYYRLTDAEGTPEGVIACAKALGAPMIRVWAGNRGSADASCEDRAMVIKNARRMADMARAEGIGIVFEFHGGTLADTAESAIGLLKDIDRPNVFTHWQPPVGMPDRECLDSLRAVSRLVPYIHVFTWNDRERLPLEAGTEKWMPLLREAEGWGRDIYALLEFVMNDEPGQLKEDAECLRRWLEEVHK
ncbi:MAG: sugar phosphate isomerase/epimerase [Clostridia bacterium]|nr:sugar phosphate isomerase/epimerase [Clostridia bacterium]